MKCMEITDCLKKLSPESYAENWDNVGLLVGRKEKEVHKIMVALDATNEVVKRAVDEKADMLITHHPMIFSSVKKINEDTPTTEKILTLAENRISYYAMHTNFDTIGGMGELAAGPDYLDLTDAKPLLKSIDELEGMGRGGFFKSPMTGRQAALYVKEKFDLPFVMIYQGEGDKDKVFDKIAVLPGSGKSEMEEVKKQGYELYLTGDYGHHSGLDAIDMGITVIDATHYGLEKIFVAFIADHIKNNFPDIDVVSIYSGSPVEVL